MELDGQMESRVQLWFLPGKAEIKFAGGEMAPHFF